MKIQYFGHSSFKIISAAGYSVITDPFDGIGYSMPRVSANAVTVSHRHFDHDFVKAVSGNPMIIEGGAHTVGDIEISSVLSWHDEVKGAKRGKNTIFKFTADGVTVCHLGDLGEPVSCERVKSIAPADVLLIPVGGTYTLDAAEAARYVKAVAPKIVIPMHYRTADCSLDIADVEKFLKLFDSANIFVCKSGETEITSEDLKDTLKIFVLR